MKYHCWKYNDNQKKMSECCQLKEDGHCYYCPFYKVDPSITDEDIKSLDSDDFRQLFNSFKETSEMTEKMVNNLNNTITKVAVSAVIEKVLEETESVVDKLNKASFLTRWYYRIKLEKCLVNQNKAIEDAKELLSMNKSK